MQFGEIIKDILEMHHILHAINFSSNLIWGWRRGWDERGRGRRICIKDRRAVTSLNPGGAGMGGGVSVLCRRSTTFLLLVSACPENISSFIFCSAYLCALRSHSYLLKPLGVFLSQYLHDLYVSEVVRCLHLSQTEVVIRITRSETLSEHSRFSTHVENQRRYV